jgi:menaquinone-dependent protoporphyrinogen oxidase
VTVLVAYASRHGATREIAEAIAAELSELGAEAIARDAADVDDLRPFDAVVLGSAVYVGSWLEPARKLVELHGDQLSSRRTWIFSSGPIGEPPKPDAAKAVQVDAIVERVRPEEHRLFAGKIDESKLGFGERAVMHAVRAAEGDFRDWDEIRRWAAEIASALRA